MSNDLEDLNNHINLVDIYGTFHSTKAETHLTFTKKIIIWAGCKINTCKRNVIIQSACLDYSGINKL